MKIPLPKTLPGPKFQCCPVAIPESQFSMFVKRQKVIIFDDTLRIIKNKEIGSLAPRLRVPDRFTIKHFQPLKWHKKDNNKWFTLFSCGLPTSFDDWRIENSFFRHFTPPLDGSISIQWLERLFMAGKIQFHRVSLDSTIGSNDVEILVQSPGFSDRTFEVIGNDNLRLPRIASSGLKIAFRFKTKPKFFPEITLHFSPINS